MHPDRPGPLGSRVRSEDSQPGEAMGSGKSEETSGRQARPLAQRFPCSQGQSALGMIPTIAFIWAGLIALTVAMFRWLGRLNHRRFPEV
jgi:hypothetical protein